MDPTGLIALATVIVTAIFTHLKNRSQDEVVSDLRANVADLRKRIDDCEDDRRRLKEMVKRGYEYPQ